MRVGYSPKGATVKKNLGKANKTLTNLYLSGSTRRCFTFVWG